MVNQVKVSPSGLIARNVLAAEHLPLATAHQFRLGEAFWT